MRKTKRLGVLLLVGMIMMLISSCDNLPWSHSNNYDTSDTTYVAEYVESIQNPSLVNVPEVLKLQRSMQEIASVDSAFMAMPAEVVKNVSSVLLKKNGQVKKKDVVDEFRLHKDIYTALPSATPKKVDTTATDLGDRRNKVISTSYSFRTDTVNGKPVKIQIKTEESYE